MLSKVRKPSPLQRHGLRRLRQSLLRKRISAAYALLIAPSVFTQQAAAALISAGYYHSLALKSDGTVAA